MADDDEFDADAAEEDLIELIEQLFDEGLLEVTNESKSIPNELVKGDEDEGEEGVLEDEFDDEEEMNGEDGEDQFEDDEGEGEGEEDDEDGGAMMMEEDEEEDEDGEEDEE